MSRQVAAASGTGAAGGRGNLPQATRRSAMVMSKAPSLAAATSSASAITAAVRGSTSTGAVAAPWLSRVTSLSGAWKLIRR